MARFTNEETALRIQSALGDGYDLSMVKYVDSKTNITVICRKHGELRKPLKAYVKGQGCNKCHHSSRITMEVVLQRFRQAHGDKYDYSDVVYTHNAERVAIRCQKHGVFNQKPSIHWKGSECPRCSEEKPPPYILTTEQAIYRFKKVHGSRFDYSQTKYERSTKAVTIICPKHGPFNQTPNSHLSGNGCARCTAPVSKPEKLWSDMLEDITGWKIDRQKKVEGISKPVDMCVEDSPFGNIAFEYDGCYWHSREGSLERDERKTLMLISKGYKVVRLREQSKHHILKPVPSASLNHPVVSRPTDGDIRNLLKDIERALSA